MHIFEYQNAICHLIYNFLTSKRPFGIIVKSSLKIVIHVSFNCEIFTDSYKVKQKIVFVLLVIYYAN